MEYQYYLKEEKEIEEKLENQKVVKNLLVSKISIVLLIFIIGLKSYSQGIPEFGFSVGTTQYFGDLNKNNLIYNPSPAAGIVFLYNFNTRIALKTGITYYSLKGSGSLPYTSGTYEFNNSNINYQLLLSTNFLEYDHKLNTGNFTPYFNLGISFSRQLKSEINEGYPAKPSYMTIPLGPGVKYLIGNKVTIGLEYVFNKSFSDILDGEDVVNYGNYLQDVRRNTDQITVSNISPGLANKDWYSHLSLYITFKFINFGDDCPAYD